MNIVWMLLIGLVVGVVAKLIVPGKDPGGFIVTVMLGIAGSVIAGIFGRETGMYAEGATAGFIMSVVGAMLLLGMYRLLVRSRSLE